MRFLVSESERQIPIAPVPAQRVDALEGFHTAAHNAAIEDGFPAVHFKVRPNIRRVTP